MVLGSQFNLVSLEEGTLSFWKDNSTYRKCRKAREGKQRFTFIDGPPYPTGAIHLGTAWNKTLKDTILRYKSMAGFRVADTPGYDMHGLPVELKVEKELGIKNKKQIEEYGIDNFVNYCRKFAKKNLDVMSGQFIRLGVWMDWENPYMTIENYYVEGVWWGIKQAASNGYLSRAPKVLTACPRCETALAKHEQEYANVTDNSIYVKFPVIGAEKTFILIWTTTPWTLPTNMGVIVSPKFQYVYAKILSSGETLILAKELAEPLLAKLGEKFEIVKEVAGDALAGMRYTHPLLDYVPDQKQFALSPKNHSIILSEEYVHLDAGTGCVHCAPGTGPEDFEVGKKNGLDVFCPISLSGTFKDEAGKYGGLVAKKNADEQVLLDLTSQGLLFHTEKVTHEYPVCWRCKTPLIFLATNQWFFLTSALREKMREVNRDVSWVPDWGGKAWFDSWLDNLQDWCISRQRYWGVPLPIWTCSSCGEIEVIGSSKELPEQPQDLHKPWIDKITWPCKKCSGGKMTRIPDIFDVWGDSGSAMWASQRYPAENKNVFEESFPADFILEGKDQIRGWFNSLMSLSILAKGASPYKAVYMHGFVNDELGRKFSKSLGNYVSPDEVLPKYGAESLRLFFVSSASPGEDMVYAERYVREAFNTLRIFYNTYSFAQSYMALDNFRPKEGSLPLALEDRWILSRLHSLILKLTKAFDSYNVQETSDAIQKFVVNDLSRTYIKLIRDRTWVGVSGEDKLAAYQTLYTVLDNVLKISAPIIPMITEHIYQNFTREFEPSSLESVHLCDWPLADESKISPELEGAFFSAQEIIEASMAARNEAGIKLRYPVKEIVVITADEKVKSSLSTAGPVIRKMANCKGVLAAASEPAGNYAKGVCGDFTVFVSRDFDESLLGEAGSREITRKIQQMRKDNGFSVSQKIALEIGLDEKAERIIAPFIPAIGDKVGSSGISLSRISGGSNVFCDVIDLKDLGLGTIEIGFSRVD